MAEIVCIEYCRGCDKRHPSLKHDQYKFIEVFRECSQLLKLQRFEVRSASRPRVGAFVVTLNNITAFEKEEFEEFPLPELILRLVKEEKQRQWYYRKMVTQKEQLAAESLMKLNKLIGSQQYAIRKDTGLRTLNIPACLWKRPRLNTNSRSALVWFWQREDQKKRGKSVELRVQSDNPECETASFRIRTSNEKYEGPKYKSLRPMTGRQR